MKQIRWHGRGGQGAKTVSQLLALSMLQAGHFVQAFPEYGPERSGAPIQAYSRVDDAPIRLHCGVLEPDIVIVIDATLLGEVDVAKGLGNDGLLLVNSPDSEAQIAERVGFHGAVVCVDAHRLAAEVGSRYANVVMIGALAALDDDLPLEAVEGAVWETLGKKVSKEVVETNLEAIRAGYRATASEPAAVAKK